MSSLPKDCWAVSTNSLSGGPIRDRVGIDNSLAADQFNLGLRLLSREFEDPPSPESETPISLMTTAAPARAIAIAIAFPIPLPAPVTRATLPSSIDQHPGATSFQKRQRLCVATGSFGIHRQASEGLICCSSDQDRRDLISFIRVERGVSFAFSISIHPR